MTTAKTDIEKLGTSIKKQIFGTPEVIPTLPLLDDYREFGNNGRLHLPLDSLRGYASGLIESTFAPSKYLTTFYETRVASDPEKSYLARIARFTSDGALDSSFGDNNGLMNVPFAEKGTSVLKGLHETPSGELYIWGYNSVFENTLNTNFYLIQKRLPSGELDRGFGNQGIVNLHSPLPDHTPLRMVDANSLIFSANDGIYVAIYNTRDASQRYYLIRLTMTGQLDKKFQDEGLMELALPGHTIQLFGLISTTDAKLILCGAAVSKAGTPSALLMKLGYDGSADLSFGKNGVSQTPVSGYSKIAFTGIQARETSGFVAHGFGTQGRVTGSIVMKFKNEGVALVEFNKGEPLFERFNYGGTTGYDVWIKAVEQAGSKKTLAVGRWENGPNSGPVMARLNSDGTLDGSFLPGDIKVGTVDGQFFDNEQYAFIITQPDQILVAGNTESKPVIFALRLPD